MRFSFADGLFWLSAACCAVAQVFIIRSVQLGRGRQRTDSAAVASRSRFGVEMLWVVLPALGLATLLFFTWRAVRANESAPDTPRAVAVGA